MVNLVRTDFGLQGINALNKGINIGGAIQNRQRQGEADAQQQQLFRQKTQLNQGEIDKQERASGMAEMITALNLPFDKRNELFAELEAKKQNPEAKKFLSHMQTLDDKKQLTTMLKLLNQQQGKVGVKKTGEQTFFESLTSGLGEDDKTEATLIRLGLKGRAVGSAIQTISREGLADEIGRASATIKQREKFASMTGASRAKAIDAGFVKMNKIDLGLRNMSRAVELLDKGAGVGAIEQLLPSIKAASVELDNIRGRMALDVVGATTFGALSKGELDIAKSVALPTGLDTEALKAHLIERMTAQQKLRDYYNEQIQHLDAGGTIASFLRKKERDTSAQPTTSPPQPKIQPSQPITGAPQVGQESDGYRYTGGDPSLEASWEKI